jgi:predicted nucleotidyltransferase
MEKAEINAILNDLEKRLDISIIYAVEAGSRSRNMESETSDFDLRFIFIHKDKKKYVSLKEPKDVIDGCSSDKKYDWQGFDIKKALRHLHCMNPNMTEWVHSSIIYKNETLYNNLD